MGGRGGWTAIAMIVLVGCTTATSLAPPASKATGMGPMAARLPNVPRDALPGYVVHVTNLDAATLSGDALDPASFEAMLTGAGFQAGIERRFTARWKPLTEIEASVLRFRDRQGADTYLAWMSSHGTDLLGSGVERSVPPPVPGAIAFSHQPCDGCTKDPLQYLAAWTRGRYAVTLLVGGPRAGIRTATPLVRELDGRIRTKG